MTKQEIEKAIENGESVWVVFKENIEESPNLLCEVDIESIVTASGIGLIYFNKVLNKRLRTSYSQCFKTQQEALHYANHANITRTETMPFLTYEKFKEDMNFIFNDINGMHIEVFLINGRIIMMNEHEQELFNASCNFKSFLELYDECVKLFKGETEWILI